MTAFPCWNIASQSTGPPSGLNLLDEPWPASTQRSEVFACFSHSIRLVHQTFNGLLRLPHGQQNFPSVFRIVSEQDLIRAGQLILMSRDAMGPSTRKKASPMPEYLAEKLPADLEYVEGASSHVLVNAYERNRRAREACLRHYGRSCTACGFNFEANYGETTAGYIHVHHVIPMAKVGTKYRLRPIKDLRPVCPNCHAVIHRRDPPFSIEEIQHMLRKSAAKGST